MSKLDDGRRVFDLEIQALEATKNCLDDIFVHILDEIVGCKGKLVITGMGKPGHVAQKLAATFSSLGTPSFFLHPAEAMHGDLGMVSENDIVLAISYSGESDEIIRILPNLKLIGAKIIGITGNPNSTLAKFCDLVQVLPPFKEACYLGLAPTSSTTVEMCYGDALAVAASEIYGFSKTDFGEFHPAGSLGKRLILKVKDLMASGKSNSLIFAEDPLLDAITEISKKGLGIVTVIDGENKVVGIITDGDLRRLLEKKVDIYSMKVEQVMNNHPILIESGKMAIEALTKMREKNVSCLPVVENEKCVGTIKLQSIVNAGIVG